LLCVLTFVCSAFAAGGMLVGSGVDVERRTAGVPI
jgi:hypothetical protein